MPKVKKGQAPTLETAPELDTQASPKKVRKAAEPKAAKATGRSAASKNAAKAKDTVQAKDTNKASPKAKASKKVAVNAAEPEVAAIPESASQPAQKRVRSAKAGKAATPETADIPSAETTLPTPTPKAARKSKTAAPTSTDSNLPKTGRRKAEKARPALTEETGPEATPEPTTAPKKPRKASSRKTLNLPITTPSEQGVNAGQKVQVQEVQAQEELPSQPIPAKASKGRKKPTKEQSAELNTEQPQPSKAAAKKAKAPDRPRKTALIETVQESGAIQEAQVIEATEPSSTDTQLDTPQLALQPAVAEVIPTAQDSEGEVTDLVIAQLRKMGRPVHIRDFERSFTRVGRDKLGRDLGRLLEDLTRSGLVIRTRRNTYGLPDAMNLVRGRFQASSSGFGFVIPDSGGDDFYIREGETLEAWNGDTVLVRPEGRPVENRYDRRRNQGRSNSRNDSPRAAVVRIVSRAYSRLVGSLEYLKGYAFLKPDDHRARHRIMLVQDQSAGLPAGARVVTQLFWPEDTGEDEVYGEVVQVLGEEDDPATETQAVIVKYGLHDEFPPAVLAEADKIPGKVPASATKGRLDLREYNIFTVDGSDAKDFDDAIHIQSTPEGNFVVGIHIADVSHYVRPGTALDNEAYDRATSVYLPGSVLPMLPEHLSNGVCSLVPYEDRLTMSAMIELSGDGEILDAKFSPSVIRSKARLTYDEVQAYSEASATLPEHARALEGDLHLLLKITAKLRQKRLREGALDFKMREVKVDIGKDGQMQLIPLHEETARGMIEDLMLLANKAVAHFLLEKNVPTLYRIHEEPTLGRFQEASAAIGRMGLGFPGGVPTPQAYQAVLKEVRGTPQESVVNTLLLRSLQQAKYAGENLGHFGLAFKEYLHFTSPIRRYPDLLVHRALKLALQGDVSDRVRAELAAPLSEQGRHTSERERNAAEAERDLTKYYQAKWAQEHLQEVFEGRVSGVIASGLFVALENGVEGRLHISNLDDDYYVFIEEASILKGRSSGRTYRIGDALRVSISKVNPLARQIDFAQETPMDGNDHKPRARRREDRSEQKREKLSSFLPQQSAAPRSDGQEHNAQEHNAQEYNADTKGADARGADSSADTQPRQRESYRAGSGSIRRDDSRSQGRSATRPASSSGFRRRVVTLERPRNEHLRPVNITVQRMYFGDWTLENMPPEEGQGERSYRSGSNYRGRSNAGYAANGASRQPRREGSERREPQSERPQPPRENRSVGSENSSDEAKRRRRRRGRRGGGSEGSGNSQE